MLLSSCSNDNDYIEQNDLIKEWESVGYEHISINDDEGRIRIEFMNDGKANVIFNGESSVLFDAVTYKMYKDFITFHNGRILDGTYQITENEYGYLTIASGDKKIGLREVEKDFIFYLNDGNYMWNWKQNKDDGVTFIFNKDMKTGHNQITFSDPNYKYPRTFFHYFSYTFNSHTKQLYIDYDDDEPDETYNYVVVMKGKDKNNSAFFDKEYLLLFKQESSTNYTCVMKLMNIGTIDY